MEWPLKSKSSISKVRKIEINLPRKEKIRKKWKVKNLNKQQSIIVEEEVKGGIEASNEQSP